MFVVTANVSRYIEEFTPKSKLHTTVETHVLIDLLVVKHEKKGRTMFPLLSLSWFARHK